MKRFLSILFLLPLAYNCTIAQHQVKYADLITEESSKKHLEVLTSKEFAGRGTGQEGGLKAARYIAEQFKSYGLKPVVNGNSYFQEVKLLKSSFDVQNFVIGLANYKYGQDFYVQGNNPFHTYESNEIIFVGYGIQDEKYNELKEVDIKGKVILVINEGEPTDVHGKSLITGSSSKSEWSTSRFKRIQELQKLNPKVIISTNSQVAETIARFKNRLTASSFKLDKGNPDITNTTTPPVVNITEDMANKILATLNTSIATYKIKAAESLQKPTAIKTKFEASMGVKIEKIEVPNVIGLLEGTTKKDEIVVVAGHYDHDGILPDGTYFPGADDNGSGTVAVIELAKAFSQAKKDGKGPKRSILFIGLAAEEKGLLGSDYYVEHPILPLDKTIACVNIDMIGRIDNKHLEGDHNYIHVIGVNKLSTDLKPIVELANKNINMKLDYDYDHPDEPMRLYYRSDHYNFAKKGIPSLFFFSGLHPHYHTPEDTIEKIDFPMMVKREKLIFNTVWELADRPNKPKVDLSLEEAKGTGR